MGLFFNIENGKVRSIMEFEADGEKSEDDSTSYNMDNEEENNEDTEDNEEDTTTDTDDTEDEDADEGDDSTEYNLEDEEDGNEATEEGNGEDDTADEEESTDDDSAEYNLEDEDTDGEDNGEEGENEDTEEDDDEGTEYTMDDGDEDTGEGEEGVSDPSGDDDSSYNDDNSSADDADSKLKELEGELFDTLSDEQKAIKINELKKCYQELHERCDNIIEMLNNAKAPDENTSRIFEYLNNNLNDLKQYIYDYFTNTFDTRSYLENTAQYQKYIAVLNSLNTVLEEVVKKKKSNK